MRVSVLFSFRPIAPKVPGWKSSNIQYNIIMNKQKSKLYPHYKAHFKMALLK